MLSLTNEISKIAEIWLRKIVKIGLEETISLVSKIFKFSKSTLQEILTGNHLNLPKRIIIFQ